MSTVPQTPTSDQVRASIKALMALAEAIRSLGSIPAGHLYVQVMSVMDLHTFDSFIDRLIGAELVQRDKSHLLRWVGPTMIGGAA